MEKKDSDIFIYEEDFKDNEAVYKRALRKLDFRVVAVIALSYIFTQINKNNISNAAILNLETNNGIKHELGDLSSGQWSWCLSAFYYPYLIFEAPFTMLAKKVSPRLWQARIMITWGIVSMLQATAFNFSSLVAARFFLGLLEASWYTTALYHLSFFYKPRVLPTRVAFFYSFGMLSGGFSGILAYGISFMNQKRNLSGWRWVFIFEGIPTILIGTYNLFLLPSYPEECKFLNAQEKKAVIESLPSSAPRSTDSAFNWALVKELLKDSTFYTYIGIWLFQGIGGWGISFVLPTIVYELGFTDTANTQLMQLPPAIFGFLLLNVLGYLIQKKYISAFPTAIIMSLTQIGCYIVLIKAENKIAKYLMLILATGISNSLYPVLWPDRMRVVNGTSSSALAIGATNASCQLMGLVGPVIYQSKFGPSYYISYSCSIALCSVSCTFIGVTWYLVRSKGLLHTEGAIVETKNKSCEVAS